MRRMTRAGLQTIEACHRAHDGGRGQPSEGCNVLPVTAGSDWGRQINRTRAFVSAKCAQDDVTVRGNYPPCGTPGCDNVTTAVVDGTRDAVQTNIAGVTGEDRLTGAEARCRRALLRGHRRLATGVLDRAQRCQARLDLAGTGTYGPISEACLSAGASPATGTRAKLARACGAVGAAEVGSCEPFPDCVVEAAQELGHDMARLTYGQPATCGDGVPDPGEECDDGNDIRTDDCDACTLPVCGDGITAGREECDDQNTTPGDGCTDCTIDAVACGAGGMRATVTYDDPQATGAAAGRMLIAYPAAVSLPGSGPAGTVRQRVANASPTSNPIFLPSDDDGDTDGVDDTLVIVWGIPSGPWPAGPFGTVTFDCAAGTPVRAPDFACSFDDASDAFSNAVDPAALVCAVTVLEPIP